MWKDPGEWEALLLVSYATSTWKTQKNPHLHPRIHKNLMRLVDFLIHVFKNQLHFLTPWMKKVRKWYLTKGIGLRSWIVWQRLAEESVSEAVPKVTAERSPQPQKQKPKCRDWFSGTQGFVTVDDLGWKTNTNGLAGSWVSAQNGGGGKAQRCLRDFKRFLC